MTEFQVSVTFNGLTFTPTVPDGADVTVTVTASGGFRIICEPAKESPFSKIGEALVAGSRNKTDQKRAQLQAVEEA